MWLEGSCHCSAVRFEVNAPLPYPFMCCYCSICRKSGAGGGYAVNLGAEHATLDVYGADAIAMFHARRRDPETGAEAPSDGERRFCSHCGSALWVWDPHWPELVHPFASAIDTELPVPPERVHIMLASKPAWVPVHADPDDRLFDGYPDESLAAWHQRLGLER